MKIMCISLPVGIIILIHESDKRPAVVRRASAISLQIFFQCTSDLEYPGNKNFQPDSNEDDTAKDRSFIGELCSEFLADDKTGNTDKEGNRSNDERGSQCHYEAVFCDGKPDR